jgi:hypothetical protein
VAGPVEVHAILAGRWCEVSPARFTVVNGEMRDVTVHCVKTGRTRRGVEDCSAPTGLVGWVTINTKPYSEIWFGDKKLGETPLAKVKLPSGCFEIRAVAVESRKERKIQIEVQPNKNLRYQFDVP